MVGPMMWLGLAEFSTELNPALVSIVVESFVPGTVVTQLAQRRGCCLQQIHDWRRLARTGKLVLPAHSGGEAIPAFVPLLPDNSMPAPAVPVTQEPSLDVEIAGATVHVRGRPGAEALLDVFSALRRSR